MRVVKGSSIEFADSIASDGRQADCNEIESLARVFVELMDREAPSLP